MVYSNKLVAVIKCDGRILRDEKDLVKLPFGSEYSILIKNLSMERALVSVRIDNINVLNYNKIVIDANADHEIFGFMNKSGAITNKFKFIQKTEKIVEHRGDNIDDGFINISFQFEKPYIPPVVTYYPPKTESWIYGPTGVSNCRDVNAVGIFSCQASHSGPLTSAAINYCCTDSIKNCEIQQDEGITVKGSQLNKQYENTFVRELYPEKHNIIIRLKGFSNNAPIVSPVYTNTKLICDTCGKKCKSHMKFCPECGTSLI